MGYGGSASTDLYNEKFHSNTSGYQTSQKVLSQDAFNKIVYDVLSSDQGLASLASGENASGGFGSSSKTLLAQDLTAKLAGELANVTAETVNTNAQSLNTSKTGWKQNITGKMDSSVICTALMKNGYVSQELYISGKEAWQNLSKYTVVGYRAWADPIAVRIPKSKVLRAIFLPLAVGRYKWLQGKKSLPGAISIFILQPLSYCLGFCILKLQVKKSDSKLSEA